MMKSREASSCNGSDCNYCVNDVQQQFNQAAGDKTDNELVFVDLDSLNHEEQSTYSIPSPLFGGGVGLAKLSDEKRLVITTGPGGQSPGDRFHHFYELTESGLSLINTSKVEIPSSWSNLYGFSESLSVLTECGTGDIYTVHATGDESGLSAVNGSGYWRLSKLEEGESGELSLTAIEKFLTGQSMTDCSVRASGMMMGNESGDLEVYCHGYAKEPDGASIPFLGYVLGPPKDKNVDSDTFLFKIGTL